MCVCVCVACTVLFVRISALCFVGIGRGNRVWIFVMCVSKDLNVLQRLETVDYGFSSFIFNFEVFFCCF